MAYFCQFQVIYFSFLGLSGLLVGHPLDTVKALIQTRNHKTIRNSIRILSTQQNVCACILFLIQTLENCFYMPNLKVTRFF